MIKTLDFQINTCENNLREYCNKTMNAFEKNVTNNLNDMNMRISEVKMENNKYSYELKKSSENLIKEVEGIMKMKEEVVKKNDADFNKIKEVNKATNDNFDDLRTDFNQMQAKFSDLSEFIKVNIINMFIDLNFV